jgi:hypothetical protein
MRWNKTHWPHTLALVLVCALAGSRGPSGAFAEQASVEIDGDEEDAPPTRVQVDFTITIPELLEVRFPTSADEGAIPQIASNIGILTITVDNESYTYVATSKRERLFLIGEPDATAQTLVSGPQAEIPTHVEVYTVAIP